MIQPLRVRHKQRPEKHNLSALTRLLVNILNRSAEAAITAKQKTRIHDLIDRFNGLICGLSNAKIIRRHPIKRPKKLPLNVVDSTQTTDQSLAGMRIFG
jgi:hypothetical protein